MIDVHLVLFNVECAYLLNNNLITWLVYLIIWLSVSTPKNRMPLIHAKFRNYSFK
ncbi:transmembrane protein, putative [Medicago truncatula]|uniref:Transmembrane protein, putative n=1 Tax=Medicago truncatula TaxID=3880 RepID=G7ILA3_MEDTR|nr:transmembrane protein, putative [Medicago truncatula]